ncbi:dihydrolipoamide acetyltransferase family protein [soil metagenome]
MIVEVTLPQLGETAAEAEILEWFKTVGDPVARGDPLLEVHTDKINVEIPALSAGILREITVQSGQVVAVGATIAKLETTSESLASQSLEPGSSKATSPGATPQIDQKKVDQVGVEKSAAVPADRPADTTEDAAVEDATVKNKVRASPSARRLARELQVSLQGIAGTGPNGRVTGDDVRRSATDSTILAEKTSGTARALLQTTAAPAEPTVHTLTRVERAVAKTTAAAFSEMPHFYVSVRAEATRLAQLLKDEASVSLNDALVLACALALKQHPRLNSSLSGHRLTLHEHVHVGVITATPEGLVTGVVRDADRLNLRDIHSRVREVRALVAAGRAAPEDVSGATFCVSNLGMYGVDAFSAIVLPPNAAILAVGALREEALVEDGALRLGRTLALTVSADHRALDGVAVALFLATLRATIEVPHNLFDSFGCNR